MEEKGQPGRRPWDACSPAEDRERYRSLFLHTPHAAFALDLEGRYEAVNPASCALTGYTEAEFLSMGFDSVVHPDDLERVVAVFHQVVERRPTTVECGVRRKDGSKVEVSLTGVPVIVDDEVIGVHGVAEDITVRNRALRELETARQVAEDANAAKSLFLANVSHELRTPLAASIAALEMLEDVEIDAAGLPLLGAARRSGERLMGLVDDLLDFISLATGGAKPRSRRFDPAELVHDVAARVLPVVEDGSLDLSVGVSAEVPALLAGDADRLAQALHILLENAVKFTDHGSVRVAASVSDCGERRCGLRLEVADTGIGISQERQSALFDPFVQGDGTMTRRHGGTGLGLAIFRELVALMEGSYEMTSAPGRGTTISLTVPLSREIAESPR